MPSPPLSALNCFRNFGAMKCGDDDDDDGGGGGGKWFLGHQEAAAPIATVPLGERLLAMVNSLQDAEVHQGWLGSIPDVHGNFHLEIYDKRTTDVGGFN